MRRRSRKGRNSAERAPATTLELARRAPRARCARACAARDAGMPFGRLRAEARSEALEKLRGERDLRHHHQRLPALLQRGGDRLEIDLGLAGAGDAFEQKGLEAARARRPRSARRRRRSCAGFSTGARNRDRARRATGSGGAATASSAPSSTSASMTPAEQAAASAQRFLGEGHAAFRRRRARARGWASGARGAAPVAR